MGDQLAPGALGGQAGVPSPPQPFPARQEPVLYAADVQPALDTLQISKSTFRNSLRRAWREKLLLAERILLIGAWVVGFVAFLLGCAYSGLAVPRTNEQALAWVARCYESDTSNGNDTLDPATSPNTFAWANVTHTQIGSLPSVGRARDAEKLASAALVMLLISFVVAVIIGRCRFDGQQACRCCNGSMSVWSAASLILGTVLTIIVLIVYAVARTSEALWADCNGAAWHSEAAMAKQKNYRGPYNNPRAVHAAGYGGAAFVGLVAVVLLAAHSMFGALAAAYRDDGPRGAVVVVTGTPVPAQSV